MLADKIWRKYIIITIQIKTIIVLAILFSHLNEGQSKIAHVNEWTMKMMRVCCAFLGISNEKKKNLKIDHIWRNCGQFGVMEFQWQIDVQTKV